MCRRAGPGRSRVYTKIVLFGCRKTDIKTYSSDPTSLAYPFKSVQSKSIILKSQLNSYLLFNTGTGHQMLGGWADHQPPTFSVVTRSSNSAISKYILILYYR